MPPRKLTPQQRLDALDAEKAKLDEKEKKLKEEMSKQRKQLQAREKREKTRIREEEEKLETRRKIISGAIIRKHIATNPGSDVAKLMARLHDEYVEPHNRELMGLPPLPTPAKSTNDNSLKEKFPVS